MIRTALMQERTSLYLRISGHLLKALGLRCNVQRVVMVVCLSHFDLWLLDFGSTERRI